MKRWFYWMIFVVVFVVWNCSDVQNPGDKNGIEPGVETTGEPSVEDAGGNKNDAAKTDSAGNQEEKLGESSLKGQLILNEIAAAGEPSDWVELYNAGSSTIDLSRVFLSDDLNDLSGKVRLQGKIQPGEYKVFFLGTTEYPFKLGKDEEVGLFDENDALIDSVDWSEGQSPEGGSYGRIPDTKGDFKTLLTPTPGKPNVDGTGAQESPMDGKPEEEKDNEPSVEPNGNDGGEVDRDEVMPEHSQSEQPPQDSGKPDVAPAQTGLVINEVVAAGQPNDWFELHNTTTKDIDLSTFTVADDLNDLTARTAFPSGTILKAGEYKVFQLTKSWPGFSLGKDEELGVFDKHGKVVDSVNWKKGDSPEKKSYGRFPNATGGFVTMDIPTPGKPNVALILNELAAAGQPNDWFELYNATTKDIDLSMFTVADDLKDFGARVKFPSGAILKAGEYKVFQLTKSWPGFSLGKDEELGVFDKHGKVVDSVNWKKGDSPEKKSYGRHPDLTGAWKTLDKPSPGKANPSR